MTTRAPAPRGCVLRGLLLAAAFVWSAAARAQDPQPGAPSEAAAATASPAAADPGAVPPAAPAPVVRVPSRPGLQSYSVAIQVTFSDAPEWTPEVRRGILRDLQEQVGSGAGPLWEPLAIEEAGRGLVLSPIPAETRALEAWRPALEGRPEDKVFLAALDVAGAEYTLRAGEWDRSSATLGSWSARAVTDSRLVAAALTTMLADAFRPLAVIRKVDGAEAELEIQGGELLPSDPRFLPLPEKTVFIPFQRMLNREREVLRRFVVPWTYLSVESRDRSLVVGRIASAFNAPLVPGRRRTELRAILARPSLAGTRLRIVPYGNPGNPVVGARVDVLDGSPERREAAPSAPATAAASPESAPAPAPLALTTDRLGRIDLARDPAQVLRWVQVHSGSILLARVPVVPGIVPELLLEVPDDSARLTVEGELSILEGELIAIVGQREVFMARAKQLSRLDKWDEIESLTSRIIDLPSIADFDERVEAVRVRGIQSARDRKDRLAEARINKLVTTFRNLVRDHLDPEKIAGFKDEIAELKRAK
ncbi:hypothetical protein [Planctomyces sp. SH-PL14]|uniref:hypothetical protein n=1 Tax=Planctomyces sp. SH-PL14 TaxID=1632864 RepID=UPI00078E40FB|nr:hypothetical protein [Planctomyces sp. SH-PL14]AMV18378.1 hypothetical protein VT03_10840 [Planctomyces sp. SH-PL14]